jgi:glycosyltransferase involved in cell wall biosynthesis
MRRMLDKMKKAANAGRMLASWTNLRFGGAGLSEHFLHGRGSAPSRLGERSPHLLLFAWHFPPAINGGVYRPHSLARHAAKAGWRVTVLAGPLGEMESAAGIELAQSLPPAVKVCRAPASPTPSYRLIPKSGDGCFPEIIAASEAALAACQDDPPTAVLASGPPFHTFISAYFVAKRFGAPLVLDYRDEWCVHTPHFVDVTAFDRKWEKRLLRSASAIVFVTEATRDLYLASVQGLDSKKCFVVPNGWDPDEFDQAPAVAPPSSKQGQRFVISFVGTIGLHNNPGAFLARFQEAVARCPSLLDRLLLRFTGPKITEEGRRLLADFRDRFESSVELVEGVAKPAAIAEMRGAGSLLLLLDPFYEASIPGKLYEYLAAGPPILVFGETGIAADLVRRLGAGIAVPVNDSRALGASFERLLRKPCEQWDTPERKTWVAKHTRAELAGRVLNVLIQAQKSGLEGDMKIQNTPHPARALQEGTLRTSTRNYSK